MKKFHVKLTGETPYLMNRFPGTVTQSTSDTSKKDYKDDVKKALYVTKDGKYYIPSLQLRACLRESEKIARRPKHKKFEYSNFLCNKIEIIPDELEISPQEYTIDMQTVKVHGRRKFRYRPMWKTWSIEFDVEVIDDTITAELVKEAFVVAGWRTGIGDYRPRFGKFNVEEFKEKK